MKHSKWTVFPDTNTLLHYPQIKDVDWRRVFDADAVCIVLCMQVIHELDQKKDDSRLSSRAQRAIKEIKAIRASGQPVREGVTLEIFIEEPRSSDFPEALSPDSGDDRIIFLVKRYIAQKNDSEVSVYSEDNGMLLKCEAHGILFREPEEETRLQNPQTEQDKKYKAAITELNNLKSQSPQLDFRVIPVSEDEEPKRNGVILRVFQRPDPVDVNAAVEKEKSERQLPPSPVQSAVAEAVSQLRQNYVPIMDRKKYNDQLEDYLQRYRRWVESMNAYNLSLGEIFRFRLEISNTGQVPAEDIEATLTLPPCLQFVGCDEKVRGSMMGEAPKPPAPPKKPVSKSPFGLDKEIFSRDYSLLSRLPVMPPVQFRHDPSFDLHGDVDTGFAIQLQVPRLLHFKCEVFGDFYSMFRPNEKSRPFQGSLAITAGNSPEKSERFVPFVFNGAEARRPDVKNQ